MRKESIIINKGYMKNYQTHSVFDSLINGGSNSLIIYIYIKVMVYIDVFYNLSAKNAT